VHFLVVPTQQLSETKYNNFVDLAETPVRQKRERATN
jgi:hypothetical protein